MRGNLISFLARVSHPPLLHEGRFVMRVRLRASPWMVFAVHFATILALLLGINRQATK